MTEITAMEVVMTIDSICVKAKLAASKRAAARIIPVNDDCVLCR